MIFLLLYCSWEIGCGGCTGWSQFETELWFCHCQSAISAVKYDSAAACQFFSFDLWKMLFWEQKSNVLGGHTFCEFLVLEFWLCRLWNKWASWWFSQEYEQWKTQNSEVANHMEYPLEAEFATWMVICLTFSLWWVTFVNCFCLQMECKNWDYSFKSDCQTNYSPGKQLENILYACIPCSFQKKLLCTQHNSAFHWKVRRWYLESFVKRLLIGYCMMN